MKIAIIGRSEILYECAKLFALKGHDIVLVISAKEAPEYTKTLSDFRQLALDLRAEFIHTPNLISAVNALEVLQRLSPIDIGISFNYTGIIPQNVIDLFQLGILNAHGGDLPRYRGNACQAWAILNGEDRIGLCVHKMVGGELDSGAIIARDYFSIDTNTKVTEVWRWMSRRIPELMIKAVNQLEEDPRYILENQCTDPTKALRCYPRMPDDGRIDWNKPAIDVLRLINACNKPYAGAFCYLDDEKVVIWDAELVEDGEIFCAVPGQITTYSDCFIDVACRVGKLRIFKIEVQGLSNSPNNWIQSIRKRLT